MTNDADRRDAALGWLVRTNDAEFDCWDEFTAWLEQDSGNADAYHALAASEAELRPLVEQAGAPPEQTPKPERQRLALVAVVAALAAAVAAVVAPRLMPIDLETRPGEMQVVAIGGSDRLVMNGGTRLELAGWNHRTIRLMQGQVLLKLRDSGLDKVEVETGDLTLVDVGTVFEVARDGTATRVTVSEGAVLADPAGAALEIAAGQRLDTIDGATILQANPADRNAVGGFEDGQLVYDNEPLENVLSDLRRSTGLDIYAGAAMSARRFTGTLSVADVKRDPKSLGLLVGVSIEQSGTGWTLGGRT